MRRVCAGDVFSAASCVAKMPEAARRSFLAGLFDDAHCADKYRKKTGKSWCGSDGTIRGALGCSADFAGFSDSGHTEAARLVLECLGVWRAKQMVLGGRR